MLGKILNFGCYITPPICLTVVVCVALTQWATCYKDEAVEREKTRQAVIESGGSIMP